MIAIFVGPSNCGKSFAIKDWLLPAMLGKNPRAWCSFAPQKFEVALVQDAPTAERPRGQYPGMRYHDVADWLRKPVKTRLSCFNNASVPNLCRVAWTKVPRSIIVLDEIDECMPAGPDLSEYESYICNRGRHNGIALVGTARRLNAMNREVRGNIQYLYVNNLSDRSDRADAAKMMGLGSSGLDRYKLQQGQFVEWDRPAQAIFLTEFRDGKRLRVKRLDPQNLTP